MLLFMFNINLELSPFVGTELPPLFWWAPHVEGAIQESALPPLNVLARKGVKCTKY
jgi:hypothetical protein